MEEEGGLQVLGQDAARDCPDRQDLRRRLGATGTRDKDALAPGNCFRLLPGQLMRANGTAHSVIPEPG